MTFPALAHMLDANGCYAFVAGCGGGMLTVNDPCICTYVGCCATCLGWRAMITFLAFTHVGFYATGLGCGGE